MAKIKTVQKGKTFTDDFNISSTPQRHVQNKENGRRVLPPSTKKMNPAHGLTYDKSCSNPRLINITKAWRGGQNQDPVSRGYDPLSMVAQRSVITDSPDV
jgi:hypothetical protein